MRRWWAEWCWVVLWSVLVVLHIVLSGVDTFFTGFSVVYLIWSVADIFNRRIRVRREALTKTQLQQMAQKLRRANDPATVATTAAGLELVAKYHFDRK